MTQCMCVCACTHKHPLIKSFIEYYLAIVQNVIYSSRIVYYSLYLIFSHTDIVYTYPTLFYFYNSGEKWTILISLPSVVLNP